MLRYVIKHGSAFYYSPSLSSDEGVVQNFNTMLPQMAYKFDMYEDAEIKVRDLEARHGLTFLEVVTYFSTDDSEVI